MTEFAGKHVLLIAPEPFLTPRGTPINVSHMCEVLCQAGLKLDLATYPLGEDIQQPNLQIFRSFPVPGIKSVPIGFSWRKVIFDILLQVRVAGLIARRRYDLVHAVEESVFLALPFSYLGVNFLYDLDSFISDQLFYTGVIKSKRLLGLVRRLEALAIRRSTAAITVCEALSETVHRLSPGTKVFQIEDCPPRETLRSPDPGRIETLRSELGIGNETVAVYTGNLESYQGIDLLLDTAATLAQRELPVVFVLVGGEAEEVEVLRAEVQSRNLDKRVLLTGQRALEEIPEWMGLGDLLLSPRVEGENTPLKIYTYMHTGKPIVATNIRSHAQILDSSMAWLTEPAAEAYAAAIVEAVSDPVEARRRGTTARQVARRNYDFESFRQKLCSSYRQVLLGNAASS